MDKEIKICFGMYYNYINSIIKLTVECIPDNVDGMSVDEIRSYANILHMKYILSSSYSVSESSIAIISYKHLTGLIDKNLLLNKINIIDNDYLSTKEKINKIEAQLNHVNNNTSVDDLKDKPKGWIF